MHDITFSWSVKEVVARISRCYGKGQLRPECASHLSMKGASRSSLKCPADLKILQCEVAEWTSRRDTPIPIVHCTCDGQTAPSLQTDHLHHERPAKMSAVMATTIVTVPLPRAAYRQVRTYLSILLGCRGWPVAESTTFLPPLSRIWR